MVKKAARSNVAFVELVNFGNPCVLKGSMFRDWLIDQLPWAHIISEHVGAITYCHKVMRNAANPNKVDWGRCFLPAEGSGDAARIVLYKMPGAVRPDRKLMLMRHVAYHEIGHTVYSRLRQRACSRWEGLIEPNRPERSILQTDPILSAEEEFGECYAHYIQQSGFLKWVNAGKYDFLRIEAFACREYHDYGDYEV